MLRLLKTKMILRRLYSKKALTGFELVYNFPYINIGAAINKFKLKYSVLTGVSLPVLTALEYQTIIPANSVNACIIFGK